MNDVIDQQLRAAAVGESLGESAWLTITDHLLDEFGKFISREFVRDSACTIDASCGSFSRWFWAEDPQQDPLQLIWSAVLAGGRGVGHSYCVSVSLFLFHGDTRERLISKRGGTYLSFSFNEGSNGSRLWTSLGWTQDEWNEWEDVEFFKT